MKVLLVDAFDSFIQIVDLYLRELGCETEVVRADVMTPERVTDDVGLLLLGPGPGAPEDSVHVDLVRCFAHEVPIFGICLGHQAIGVAFGRRVERAARPLHGGTSLLERTDDAIFRGLPAHPRVTRYHSLVVTDGPESDDLVVTARAVDDDHIMAMRHRHLPVTSVQFHPESVLTDDGRTLLANVLDEAAQLRPARSTAA